MSIKNSRPYFSKEVVDKIVSVFNSELSKDNFAIDQIALISYIKGAKNGYENSILSEVANGVYLATVRKDEVSYKPAAMSKDEIDDIIRTAVETDIKLKADKKDSIGIPTYGQIEVSSMQARATRLSHSLNMVAYYGSKAKLGATVYPNVHELVSRSSTSSTPQELKK